MKIRPDGRWRLAWWQGLLLAGVLTVAARPAGATDACITMLAAPAAGAAVDGHINGNPANSHNMPYAGTFNIQFDHAGPTTLAYCVDLTLPITLNDCVPQTPPTYPCEVTYILTNFFPAAPKDPSLTDGEEAAAVQSAIWFFTDDFRVDGPANIQTRTAAIIAAATGQCVTVPPVPQTLTVSPPTSLNHIPPQTTHTVTAKLLDTGNQPVAGHAITIEVTGVSGPQSFTGNTDASGEFSVTYTNISGTVGADNVKATATFTVPRGLEFKDGTHQGVVLAGTPLTGSVEGTAVKNWAAGTCGDAFVGNSPGEVCDDGNAVNGDGCDDNCTTTGCGNGIVTSGEQCDDGNAINGDGCDANCKTTGCGNGVVTIGEQCDDGNAVDGDGCDANCTPTGCGNGVTTPPEECDDGNAVNGDGCDANCTVARCGNDVLDPGEFCDDGNTTSGDGCDANCTNTACGNGVTTPPEECDDGNTVDDDGCRNSCRLPACGDGVIQSGEACDDGNTVDTDTCRATCVFNVCGDGFLNTGVEQCDDGNLLDGDGCLHDCRLEELCKDLIDNDQDGLVDCEDTECTECGPIVRDPSTIKFRNGLDRLKVVGGLIPDTPISPTTEEVRFVFTNSNGVLFFVALPPGSLTANGNKFRYQNFAARQTGGLFRLDLYLRKNLWHLKVYAYKDLTAATVPTMGAQFLIGDDIFAVKATWTKTGNGWKFDYRRP